MTGAVTEHLSEAVQDGATVLEPWRHLTFDSALPPMIYEGVLQDWPGHNWSELVHPDQLKADGHYGRKQQPLDIQFPEIDAALKSDEFGLALFKKLGYPYPDPIYPMPLLIDDDPGYWIRAHPDTPTKIATLQIFLPADTWDRGMGTRMIDKPPGRKPAHQIAFLPNVGYAFKVSNESWHEVLQGQCHYQRRSIQVIWYNSPSPGIRYV